MVHRSCMCWWWGPHRCLVALLFVRCSEKLFLRQQHIPHIPPVPCMCFFSVLAPAGQGGYQCLDTFSTTVYLFSNSLLGWFWVVVCSLNDWHLAGPPGGPAASWVAGKISVNCLKMWSPTATHMWDLALGLVELHEVHTGPPL